jgi:ribosomal protein L39E
MLRKVSLKTFDIGCERDVNFSLHDTRRYLVITRWYTEDEVEERYAIMKKNGQNGSVPPFVATSITKAGVEILVEERETLSEEASKMCMGLPVSLRLNLFQDFFLSMEEKTTTVHFRRFWRSKLDGELKPGKQGVALKPQEFQSLLDRLDELHADML